MAGGVQDQHARHDLLARFDELQSIADGYALLDGPDGHLDIVGGVKVWSVETTLSFNGGLPHASCGFAKYRRLTLLHQLPD
ncbi:hypothetical protein USDA257_c36500 [Sinorhizobium fredii USDA 257]|jgi:hypothetical protein|uniref:Uncharacterized protein n=2 Tax=Rhizobium fredii TaxID=380 RepID=I3X8J5_SINF2|nr:hypothetical protein USDA257_c36500 [Sinorhizobium fredii USDA 257]